MKNKEDIIRRAIVLLALSDRCAMERRVIEGISHPIEEREIQRLAIKNWLDKNDYYKNTTAEEKKIFETQVFEETNEEILFKQNDYECLEPLLWSLGLISKLSDYNRFVVQDFHQVLGFGRNHSLKALIDSCDLKSRREIFVRREISMLWYWRCLELRKDTKGISNALESIRRIFGDVYAEMLTNEKAFDFSKNDFVINGKLVSKLNIYEVEQLSIIAEKRFYAFEWICTDFQWDDVDLVC